MKLLHLENSGPTVAVLLVLVVVCVLLLNLVFQSTMDTIEWQEEIYKVEAGDSLWKISYNYCPDTVDRREWVEEIAALNDLNGSTIHPGQKLIVLAPVKE
jgi:hypothetical protein